MKRILIAGAAVLALAACGEDPEIVVRYEPAPSTTSAEPEQYDRAIEEAALNAAFEIHRDEVCSAVRQLGRLTPEMERFIVETFNEGAGGPLSPAGQRQLVDLVRGCTDG